MTDPLKISDSLRTQRIDPAVLRPAQPRALEGDHKSFADTLSESISEVQRLQSQADTTISKVVAGEISDVTEAMVQLQQADVAFRTMMTVRGRVLEAYQEITRMQI